MPWLDDAAAGHRAGVDAGTVKVLSGVESHELGNRRDLLAYLPPSYPASDRRYPTLYFQDGQNLFDPATSIFGVSWRAGETLERLAAEGLEAIAIAVANTGAARLEEYTPSADSQGRGGRGDDYLRFLVGTVKPLVDHSFRTEVQRERTGILGSSLGGLVSLHALFAFPEVFGLVAALSPSLGFADGAIFQQVKAARFVPARIYLDIGTCEAGTPRWDRPLRVWHSTVYRNRTRRMRRLLEEKGYRPGRDLRYREEPDGQHDETAWGRRLPDALRFLLAPRDDSSGQPSARA